MIATCAVCGKTFTSTGAVADHISESDKGIQQDILEMTGEQLEEIRKNENDIERFSDATRGYAHVRFRDKNGTLLPEEGVTYLYNVTVAGPHWCVDCGQDFPNNFRLAEHCISTGHSEMLRQKNENCMRDLQYFERMWS
jgi:hypothetical protein